MYHYDVLSGLDYIVMLPPGARVTPFAIDRKHRLELEFLNPRLEINQSAVTSVENDIARNGI
jgi:hypothetical protein